METVAGWLRKMVVDGGRRGQQLRWHELGKAAAFRDVYTCTKTINMSTSINMITKTVNKHKVEWGDSVVLRPRRGGLTVAR
jgi:hypothetical protein